MIKLQIFTKMKIPTGSSFDLGYPILGHSDRLRDDLAGQSFQAAVSVAGGRFDLHAVSRRGVIAVAVAIVARAILRRDHTWRRRRCRRRRRAGTPPSLEDRQRSLRLLDHAEDAVEHHVDVLPLVVEAAAVLRL